jgi:AcrR family transcriptional regulator
MGTRQRQGQRKRVTKSAEDRREDILRAGEKVFTTIGFAESTIADITSAAEIAKGTFYLYFETKDHLLAALWERYVDGFLTTTQDILGAGGSWWSTYDQLLTALLEHAVQNARLHRIVYSSGNARAIELCKQSNRRVVNLIGGFVQDGTKAGAFHAADPELACRMIYHAADGMLDELIAHREHLDQQHVLRAVLQLAHRALGHPDEIPPPSAAAV